MVEQAFTVTTWNVLATAYIQAAFYPSTPPEVLEPSWRVPALVRRARELQADILCLQEVEPAVFAAIEAELSESHYKGVFAGKDGKRSDSCAVFYRMTTCELHSEQRLVYADDGEGLPPSGHIAQVLTLDARGRHLAVLNTHLKWDPPGTPIARQYGYRQANQAIKILQETDAEAEIVCGDLNVTPESEVIRLLRRAGFRYSHGADGDPAFTCNSNGEPKLIDYLCWRGALRAEPVPVPAITGRTALPSVDHPSDHLPLQARFSWQT